MHFRTTTTAAATGTLLAALLLTGCTAFSGDDPLPTPTGHAAPTTTATPRAAEGPDGTSQTVTDRQAVPAGTVVAETDAVSRSGETAVHVRVVANDRGDFTAELSGYRTTQPQPMSLEFRRGLAQPGDGWDGAALDRVAWAADEQPPATVTLADAGAYPDWVHSVVLVPAASDSGDDADRPWVGTVLGVGALQWSIPDPHPDLRVVAGAARPGAYGYAFDAADEALTGTTGTPVRYRVTRGDDRATVLERFGLTSDELDWLNPRLEGTSRDSLIEGDDLNLDPAAR